MRGLRWGAAGLLVVLAATGTTLAVGAALKEPCAQGGATWSDGRPYRLLCYSDIVALYDNEHLAWGRLPYLDTCPRRTSMCDEYPVVTMYAMRAAAQPASGNRAFLHANEAILAGVALAIAAALWREARWRALAFALAPSLALYGFMNWDLLAVACATFATVAALRGRSRAAGIGLGVGTAAKLYPALLLLPLALDVRRRGEPGRARRLVAWSAATWLVLNLPFALAAFDGWSTFFRFNASRHVDFDSLWYVGCHHLTPGLAAGTACRNDRFIGPVSIRTWIAGRVEVNRVNDRSVAADLR